MVPLSQALDAIISLRFGNIRTAAIGATELVTQRPSLALMCIRAWPRTFRPLLTWARRAFRARSASFALAAPTRAIPLRPIIWHAA